MDEGGKFKQTKFKSDDTGNEVGGGVLKTPYNSFLKRITIEDEKVSNIRNWLSTLKPEEQQDVENCLQNISDQIERAFTDKKDEKTVQNFDRTSIIELRKKYKDNKEIIDFITEKVIPMLDVIEKEEFGLSKKDILSPLISVDYIRPGYKTENISINFEEDLREFISFYEKFELELPVDFEDSMREIWSRNINEIKESIKQNGFDYILLIPPTTDLPKLHEKMTKGYKETSAPNHFFEMYGSPSGAKSENVDKLRIVLVHKKRESGDIWQVQENKGQSIQLDKILNLEDYLVFQRKYFKDTGKRLNSWDWLATKSGSEFVEVLGSFLGKRDNMHLQIGSPRDNHSDYRPAATFF